MNSHSHNMRLPSGFTLLELLLVLAGLGILVAIAVPTYVGWRADSLHREALTVVTSAISLTREHAKRIGEDIDFELIDGAQSIPRAGGQQNIPFDGQVNLDGGPVTLVFSAYLGIQSPFAPVSFDLVTGNGVFQRTSTVTIIPPLAKATVSR